MASKHSLGTMGWRVAMIQPHISCHKNVYLPERSVYPKLKNASCPKGDSGEKTGTFGDWDLDWGIAPQKKWRKELGKRLVHILAKEPEEGRCLLTCHFHEAWKWLSEPCVNRAFFTSSVCAAFIYLCWKHHRARVVEHQQNVELWAHPTGLVSDHNKRQ